jgi:hypothetical protein
MTMLIIMGNKEIKITDDEYQKLDEFLKKGKTGLVRLKNGEYINMSYVSAIKKEVKAKKYQND